MARLSVCQLVEIEMLSENELIPLHNKVISSFWILRSGADGGALTRDKGVLKISRRVSLSTVLPKPQNCEYDNWLALS
ncbi:hypothetical protein PoB_006424000 [Plakobranchus ocellatus]|uniref:Uncharacterized protein n=1 Tax=Plakobranchus ocellatus TaxID=259542 RepID=A0AAV4D0T0_9GAST|nr:hypothetical protein PoB_006424000 [Plakobranchus ocellatus]